ncbi:MAG TPA: acylphosphatase [Xanthobacteraceae bacterium]|nr:acylphosphatase [Xanthobacteraceae bacterium]
MTARVVRHVRVRGRVQGVGFRMFVEDAAALHGTEGWVRNRRDGSVEAVFAGAPGAVRAVVEACRRGPRGAWVGAVDESEGTREILDQRYPGQRFSVLRTE